MSSRIARGFLVPGLLILAVGVLPVSPAAAAGRVSLSWNDCSPIVSAIPSDGPHAYSAYVSVLGQSEPHRAFLWFMAVTREGTPSPYPDAWRFDAAGCQGSSRVRIDHLPPVPQVETCPAFAGTVVGYWIKDFSFDAATGAARILLAYSYPDGVTAVDPDVRYFLGRVEFDHSFSVVGPGTPGLDAGSPAGTCGGFEADMKLSLAGLRVAWWDLAEVEHDFALENPTLTFCGACGPTPAPPSTWGAIKGHYRR